MFSFYNNYDDNAGDDDYDDGDGGDGENSHSRTFIATLVRNI